MLIAAAVALVMVACAVAGISVASEDSDALSYGSEDSPLTSFTFVADGMSQAQLGPYYVKVGSSVSIVGGSDEGGGEGWYADHVTSVTSGYGLEFSNGTADNIVSGYLGEVTGTISKAGTISVSWTISNDGISGVLKSGTYTMTIKAVADEPEELPSYTVSINAGNGGSASTTAITVSSGTTYYASGTTLYFTAPTGGTVSEKTVTATPASGYSFSAWSPSEGTITGPTTISASFTASEYTLTIKYLYSGGGTASSTKTYTHAAGEIYSYDSPSITGYTANKAVVSGTMPAKDTEIKVYYNANSYTISVTAGTGGSVTGGGTYDYGSEPTIKATPGPGYVFGSWSDGSTEAERVITVTNDASYTANFELKQLTLTIHYVYSNGSTAADDYIGRYYYNGSYSVESPSVTGYTPDTATVSGVMGTSDTEKTVTYRIDTHKVTVNYVYADGSTAAPAGGGSYTYGSKYSIESPSIDGYKPDKETVSGTMGTSDVTEKVVYTAQSYELLIHYVGTDGSTLFKDHKESVVFGKTYSVASPSKTGYTASEAVIKGTMGSSGAEYTVTYTVQTHKVTVNYLYKATGSTAAPSDSRTFDYGEKYAITSPAITGYKADKTIVEGTMDTSDVDTTVYYTVCSYGLIIHYQYANGSKAADDHSGKVDYGSNFSVTSPDVAGYVPDTAIVTGTMDSTSGKEVYVTYNPAKLTLTIEYVDPEGNALHTKYSGEWEYLSEYSVDSPVVAGYTPDIATVKGTMDSTIGKTVKVTYTVNAPVYHRLTIESYCGTELIATNTYENVAEGDWSYPAPAVDGYTVQKAYATLSGSITEDTTVKAYYDAITYRITVSYVYSDGTKVDNGSHDIDDDIGYRKQFSYTSPTIAGYEADRKLVSGTADSDQDFVVTYTGTVVPTHRVTVKAVYASDPGTVVSQTESEVAEGERFTVTPDTIEGYAVSSIDSDDVVIVNSAFTMPAEDVTVTVTYTADIHRVTVSYVYTDGSEAHAPNTKDAAYGSRYHIVSPSIEGYEASRDAVTGTMGPEDVYETVIYTLVEVPAYTVTVNAVHASEPSRVVGSFTEKHAEGDACTVIPSALEGYTVSSISSDDVEIADGSYTMPARDITITVAYVPVKHTVTVHYVFADGSKAHEDETREVAFDEQYSIASPEIAGYEASKRTVSGTMGADDIEETITYSATRLVLTISYQLSDGSVLKENRYTYAYMSPYSVETIGIDGYTMDRDRVEGTMDDTSGKTEIVVCTRMTYSLSFYVEGELFATVTAEHGSVITAPDDSPVKDGWTFTGWEGFVAGTVVASDMDFEASFEEGVSHPFTVEFRLTTTGALLSSTTRYIAVGGTYTLEAGDLSAEGCTASRATDGDEERSGDQLTGTVFSGTMNGPRTVTVWFEPKPYTLTVRYQDEDGRSVSPTSTTTVLYRDAFSVESPSVKGMAPNTRAVEGTMGASDISVIVTYSAQQGVAFIDRLYSWSMIVPSTPSTIRLDDGGMRFLTAGSETTADGNGSTITKVVVSGTPTNTGLVNEKLPYTVTLDLDGTVYTWEVRVLAKADFSSAFEVAPDGLKVRCVVKENPDRISYCTWTTDDAEMTKTNLEVLSGGDITITFRDFGTYTITCQVNYYGTYTADPFEVTVTMPPSIGAIDDIVQSVGKPVEVPIDVPSGTVLASSDSRVTFDGTTMKVDFTESGEYTVTVSAVFSDGSTDSVEVSVKVIGGETSESVLPAVAGAVALIAGVVLAYAGVAVIGNRVVMIAGGVVAVAGIVLMLVL